MKGYKITNCAQDKRIGIVGNSLTEVFAKGCQKLKLDGVNVTMMTLDGTVIDDEDYFQSLPAQTLFIFRSNGETFQTGADLVYNVLAAINNDTLKTSIKIKSFMDENIKEKIRILSSVLDVDHNKQINLTSCSLRSKDPEWFQDLDTRAKTKEEFMFKRCQERIRSYMYKTKTDMIKSDFYIQHKNCRQYLDEVYKQFNELLTKNKHHGYYFDRSNSNCLCDKTGTFICEGAWNQSICAYERGTGHKINPYQNRESRIIFSTWNLDHWVERSRSVIPALFEASEMASKVGCSINMNYFYDLLFTTVNLKLVHIVCHDKGQHSSAKCDPNLYLKDKQMINNYVNIHAKNDFIKTKKYCRVERFNCIQYPRQFTLHHTMASHIIFASTVLCLIALSISVTASPQPIGIQKMPVTDACLRCICEGVGQCRPDTKCEGEVCGMFGITWAYWADSGKPVVSGSKPSDSDAYPKCAVNAYCAKTAIINYMDKFSEDCNDDGVVDCYDYAAIHKLGGYGCRGSLSEDFKRRFLSCHNPSIS